jgi:hypothetical protein
MDRKVQLPLFPAAPSDYSQIYFNDLVGALNRLTRILVTPGEGRQTFIVLTDLPTNDQGLEPGTTFQVDGVLYVSVLYKAFLAGTSATGAVGTVAVTV